MPRDKIDHHRTGKIHKVQQIDEEVGTLTLCGLRLPHTPSTTTVDESSEIDCGNCKKLSKN